MRILITEDVDGMTAGETHELRDGYAKALLSANKATDPPRASPEPDVTVVVDPTPVVETVTETHDIIGGYVELPEDDEE